MADEEQPQDGTYQPGILPGIASSWELPQPGILPGIERTDTPELSRDRQMEAARAARRDQPEGWDEYLGQRVLPFGSAAVNFHNSLQASDAIRRVNDGTAGPNDYDLAAQHERSQAIEAGRSAGGQMLSGLASVPAMAGEAFMGGVLARGAVGAASSIRGLGWLAPPAVEAGTQLPSLLSRAGLNHALSEGGLQAYARATPGFLARGAVNTAATEAAMPSMYLPGTGERMIGRAERGQQANDLLDFGQSAAVGYMQTLVLGSLGHIANDMPGATVTQVIRRMGNRAAVGVGEQAVADALAGAAGLQMRPDERPGHEGQMRPNYGFLSDLLEGHGDRALQHLGVSFVTFAAFSGVHEMQSGGQSHNGIRPVLESGRDMLNRLGPARASEVMGAIEVGYQSNAPDARANALAVVRERFREGSAQRAAGERFIESLPEHQQPAGSHPGIDQASAPAAEVSPKPGARPSPPVERVQAPTGTPTWFHTGTEFRPAEGGQQFHLGGEEYTIGHQDHPRQEDASVVSIRDRNGRVVDSMNFINNPNGTVSGEIPPNANRKPGMTEAMYNYAHDQGATVVPASGQNNEGRRFWGRNQAIRAGAERGLTTEQARESARLARAGIRQSAADEEARARFPGYASTGAPNGQRTAQAAGELPNGEGARAGQDTRAAAGPPGPTGTPAGPAAGAPGAAAGQGSGVGAPSARQRVSALEQEHLQTLGNIRDAQNRINSLKEQLAMGQPRGRDIKAAQKELGRTRTRLKELERSLDEARGAAVQEEAAARQRLPKPAAQDRPGSTISVQGEPIFAIDRMRARQGLRPAQLPAGEQAASFEGGVRGPAGEMGPAEERAAREALDRAGPPPIPGLSAPEQTVMNLRTQQPPLSFREIGRRMGVSYTTAQNLEKSALAKQEIHESISARHAHEQADNALSLMERAQLVSAAELHADPEQVARRVQSADASAEAALNRIVDRLVTELEHAKRDGREPDPRLIAEAARLVGERAGAAGGAQEAPGVSREHPPGAERSAEQPAPVPDAAARPVQADATQNAAQGAAGTQGPRNPAATGGNPAGAGHELVPGEGVNVERMRDNAGLILHNAELRGEPISEQQARREAWEAANIPEATRLAIVEGLQHGNTHALTYWKEILENDFGFDREHVNAVIARAKKEAANAGQLSTSQARPTAAMTPYAKQEYVRWLRNQISGQINHDMAERMQLSPEELNRVNQEAARRGTRPFSAAEITAAREAVQGEIQEDQSRHASEGGSSDERSPSSAPDTHVNAAGDLLDGSGRVIFRHAQPGAGFGSPLAESERSRLLMGGGQENAPSAEQRTGPRGVTALANEVTDKAREKDGKSPILRQARQANPEVWDRAMAQVDADPQAASRLVEDLARQIRPTSVEENALLLHERVALSNEHSRAIHEALTAAGLESVARRAGRNTADLKAASEAAFARESALSDRINRLDKIIVDTGSEWGRAGQFRKQLVAEDYSLSGMLQKAQAAAKRPLTDAEREQIKTLQAKIEELNGKLDAAEAALAKSGGGSRSPVYGEWQEALAGARGSQQQFQRQLTSHRWETLTTPQKVMDWLRRARIAEVISSPVTAAKVGASSALQLTAHPLRELIGSALRTLPGIRQVAARAPVEGRGFHGPTEAAAARAAATQGLRDGWETVRDGRSQLDILHGANDTPRTWLDWIGNLHAAEKAPAVRGAYERAFRNIEAHERAAGRDITTPAALESIGARAYQEGVREKFQQDNALVTAVDKAIASLKRPENSIGARAIGHAADLLLPVRRTPTNIVADALEHVVGLPVGAGRAGIAWARGIENLTPAQADSIMRMMKKGTLGLPLLALGFYASANLGGGYSGRRRDDDLKPGEMRLGKLVVPAWATAHHPAFMALQLGATIRRAQQNARHGDVGALEGTARGLGGLIEEVPLVRQQTETARMLEHGFNSNAVGNLARSFAVPQLIQWLAGAMDHNARGEVQQRNPHGLIQRVQVGVPGLRQNVPAR